MAKPKPTAAVERTIVAAPPPAAPVVALSLSLPVHVDQLNTDSLYVLDADVRNGISAALGCLFTLEMGKARLGDGRSFMLRVSGRTLELVAA
jgi:hypothetical protein